MQRGGQVFSALDAITKDCRIIGVPQNKLGFTSIGSDEVRTGIPLVGLSRCRINVDRNSLSMCEAYYLLANTLRTDTLSVILNADHRCSRKLCLEMLKQSGFHLTGKRLGRLDVESEHLLGVPMLSETNQALLHSGRTAGIDRESLDIAAQILQSRLEQSTFRIFADYPDTMHVTPESGEARSNIPRSSRRTADIIMRTSPEYGNWSFRTQAFHRPLDLLIKHEVAQ
jgi:hypothetical protein